MSYYTFFSIMNLFGVLKYKKMGEDFIRNSGIPFTIIRLILCTEIFLTGSSWICSSDMIPAACRAGRLTDGPYTSYDLNTLLKATAGERRAVVIDQGYFFCYSPPLDDELPLLISSFIILTVCHYPIR